MIAAAIIIVCCIAYANSLNVPFVFDDHGAIKGNTSIEKLSTAFSPPAGTTTDGRPILNFTFALNYALTGPSIRWMHITNIAIHIGCGLLLFGIARRTLARVLPAANHTLLAGALAFIWAAHPLHTESVTYLVQRAESLAGLFYLGCLYTFVRGVDSGRRAWFAASFALCAIGMGAKEIVATAPLIVLLYDRTFISRTVRDAWRARRGYYIGLLCTMSIAMYLAVRGRPGSAGFGEDMTPLQYASAQFGIVVHYIYLCLIPHPLVFDYLWTLPKSKTEIIAPATIIAGLVAVSAALLWRRNPLGFLGAWFFIILSPTSTIIPIITEVAAEHRLYLPSVAVCVLVVLAIYWLAHRARQQNAAAVTVAGSCIIAAIFCVMTIRRNVDYRSQVALWQDTVEKRPKNVRAHYNLGKSMEDENRIDEAIVQYRDRVIQLMPTSSEVRVNLALSLAKRERYDEAIAQFHEALKLNKDHPETLNNIALTYAKMGRVSDALPIYEKCLRLKPDYGEGHYNYANALVHTGQREKAVQHYEQAVKLNPKIAPAYFNWGLALEGMGRLPEAVDRYLAASAVQPGYAKADFHAGMLLARMGDTRRAREALTRAAKHNHPNAAQALKTLP